jgi:hypothetical protein
MGKASKTHVKNQQISSFLFLEWKQEFRGK